MTPPLRAPVPPDFIDALIELNQRMGQQMKDMLLDYLYGIQGKQTDATRYDLFDWYLRLIHKEGDNAAWFSMIYNDVTRLILFDPTKLFLINIMDKDMADEIRRYPIPEPEPRP